MSAWATGAWATGAWASGAWGCTTTTCAWGHGAWETGAWAHNAWQCDEAQVCAWEHGAWATGAWANGAWQCDAATPPPVVVPTVTPAGRGRRTRRRYVVEIDGQEFVTDSIEQAQAHLDRAKALAVRQAQERASEVVERAIAKARSIGPAAVKPPVIKAPKELQTQVEAIQQLYRDAALAAEIQVLMALQAEMDDEETILLSL